jgi:hypothetical protein
MKGSRPVNSYLLSKPNPPRLPWQILTALSSLSVAYMDPAPSERAFAGVWVKRVAAIYSAAAGRLLRRSGPDGSSRACSWSTQRPRGPSARTGSESAGPTGYPIEMTFVAVLGLKNPKQGVSNCDLPRANCAKQFDCALTKAISRLRRSDSSRRSCCEEAAVTSECFLMADRVFSPAS